MQHIPPGIFQMDTIVTAVQQYDNNGVHLMTNRGECLQSQIAIFAVPINDLLKMSFTPELPVAISQHRIRSSYYSTDFRAEFNDAPWQRNGFTGFALLHNPHLLCYQSKQNTLRGTVYHDECDVVSAADILRRLNTEFNTTLTPVHWHQWTRPQLCVNHQRPDNRWHSTIMFASSEFGFCYRNRMNAAIEAGRKAAIRAILALRPQLFHVDDAYILRPAFDNTHMPIGFWHMICANVMIYDVLFYSFVMLLLLQTM